MSSSYCPRKRTPTFLKQKIVADLKTNYFCRPLCTGLFVFSLMSMDIIFEFLACVSTVFTTHSCTFCSQDSVHDVETYFHLFPSETFKYE